MKKYNYKTTGESKFGLWRSWGLIGATVIVRQVTGKVKEPQLPLHFDFIEFAVASVSNKRNILFYNSKLWMNPNLRTKYSSHYILREAFE